MSTFKPSLPPFRVYKKEVLLDAAKVTDFIYQIGEDDSLRLPSKDVKVPEIKHKETQEKIQYLTQCLLTYRKKMGVGRAISAVQVGIPERFTVIYTPKRCITIINPVISKQSDTLLRYPEICMSANPIIAPVIRPAWIEFSYYDEEGVFQTWETKDDSDPGKMLNRIFQHEIDHMDGIINIDKVSSPRELILHSDPNFYEQAEFEEVKK